MSRVPALVDVVSREQRTALRIARREGVSSIRGHDDAVVRDEFIENIRQHQSDHFDVDDASASRSVRSSPNTSPSSSSASSAADAAAFAASSRVRRSPINNQSVSDLSSMLATVQQMRRSPSSTPSAPRDVAALGVSEHRDDENGDEQRDRFNGDERVGRLPARVDSIDVTRTSSTPSYTSSSASSSPTPGGYRGEQRSKLEQQLEVMRQQLLELKQSHQEKDDFIQRLVDEQEATRRRKQEMKDTMQRDARSMIKDAARAPVIKTESITSSSQPRSPFSRAFPSLSPSSSPSLIVGASSRQHTFNDPSDAKPLYKRETKRQSEEGLDEHKYEGEDKKVQHIGDLPDAADDDEIECSDDEAEIRQRDTRPDPTIKEKEPTSDNHIDSYPEWALKRETLYPYSRYKHMYASRHSLLTPLDRKNEWMRFGVLTHFNAKLYGLTARRWFESYMQELGDTVIGAPIRKIRSVAKQTLPVPVMWYDPRDDYSAAVDNDDTTQDLQEDSYTFEQLPLPLRNVPAPHEQADRHQRELTELVNTHVYHRRLKKIAQQPATPDIRPITQDMRDEEHPCARCKVPVYSVLKRLCTSCEEVVKHERLAAIEAGYRPSLETEDQVRLQHADTGSMLGTPGTPVNAFSLTIGAYADPSAKTGTSNPDVAPAAGVKKEPAVLSYREQEDELKILHHRTVDAVQSSTSTKEDQEEEDESPLGNILSAVFLPHQRQLQRRLRRPQLGGFRDRNAAVIAAVTTIGKFDGSIAEAPTYLLNLCSQAQQYVLSEPEIVTVLQRTMTGNALMWLNTNMHETFNLAYKPLQALLHRFRTQYLGPHITRDLRQQMRTTTLTNDSLTMKDLDTHYASYRSLLMRLQMTDRNIDEKETLVEFFVSLPKSVRSFIGSNVDQCKNVHDVYVMAQKSVLLNPTRAPVKQDGDLPRTIGINALPTGTKPSSKYASKPSDKTRSHSSPIDKNKATAQCFHCGDRGHFTGDCQQGKSPQTLKGQEAWAKRNKDNGWDFPYDQQWWINKSAEIAAKKAANNKPPRRERPRHASKEDAVIVSSGDDASPDEADDE
jgi:hypothetical protein